MKSLKQSRIVAIFIAFLAAISMVFATPQAMAATNVNINVSIDGNPAQIEKTCTPVANSYNVGYKGTMDMTEVWKTYNDSAGIAQLFISLASLRGGRTKWHNIMMSGTWTMSWKIDTSKLNIDKSMLTTAKFQEAYEAANPGTSFTSIMKVASVKYDDATGTVSATYELNDGSKYNIRQKNGVITSHAVRAEVLDNEAYRPSKIYFVTPEGLLTLPAANFEAGKSFYGTDPEVTGSMEVGVNEAEVPNAQATQYMSDFTPLNFTPTQLNNSIETKMIDKSVQYKFDYDSSSPVSGIEAQRPACTVANTGDTVPAPTGFKDVTTTDGTWSFVGWDQPSQTKGDTPLTFVGNWKFKPSTPSTTPSKPTPAKPAPAKPALAKTGTAVVTTALAAVVALATGVAVTFRRKWAK